MTGRSKQLLWACLRGTTVVALSAVVVFEVLQHLSK